MMHVSHANGTNCTCQPHRMQLKLQGSQKTAVSCAPLFRGEC